jgi:hypothetical protein
MVDVIRLLPNAGNLLFPKQKGTGRPLYQLAVPVPFFITITPLHKHYDYAIAILKSLS